MHTCVLIFKTKYAPKCKLKNSLFTVVIYLKLRVAQSCPTLRDPMEYIGHGILQARILEWVAFPSYRESSQRRAPTQVSRIVG